MKKIQCHLLVFLILIIIKSCSYEKNEKVNYVAYYDTAQSKIKMKGEILNGVEIGEWRYFDESGEIIQMGLYEEGFQKGQWQYSYSGVEKFVNWEHVVASNHFMFSLPTTFKNSANLTDSLTYTAIDSIDGSVFSVRPISMSNDSLLSNYFDINVNSFIYQNFTIRNAESSCIKGDGLLYYLDEYILYHSNTNKEMAMYMIYTILDKDLVVLTYTTSPQNISKARFLIGEIFYHCKFKNKRLADPFVEIKDILKRI